MQRFNFGHLEILEILLQEQSVSKAAQRLHVTPSAVSRSLSKIRAALGDEVLTQAGRGLVLTRRGSEIKDRLKKVADEARAILVERSNFNPSLMNRTFLIQANDYVVHILGSRLVAKLQELAPLSTLCFLAEGSEDIEAYRNDQIEFDLGVPGPLGPEVISQALFTERFVCAYRAKPKTRNTQMSLREFCERPHIIVSRKGKSSVLIDDELFRIGNRRSVVAIVATFFEGLDIAASSDCLVAAPKKLVVRNAKRFGLAFSPLPLKTPSLTIGLTWHPRHQNDPGHRWLRNLMQEVAKTV